LYRRLPAALNHLTGLAMPLRLTLKSTMTVPIEVDSIRLEVARSQTPAEVLATPVYQGNTQEPLGTFFEATGSAEQDNTLVWSGDCHRVKLIGAGLTEGTVLVEGTAGMHLGAEMTGGQIIVEGNATDWVGAEMQGGHIHVRGDVGHLCGAVYRGGQRGMTGGEILVDGSAGNEVGNSMRRGLIAIGGRVGDGTGLGMIAGTILVGREPGIRHGAGMKRGTIAFLAAGAPPSLLPTFRPAGAAQPTFLRVYIDHLARSGWPVPDGAIDARYRCYNGDFLESGKGEIFVRSD
jgi:formylmethanofuran dehydrogenase subunit C